MALDDYVHRRDRLLSELLVEAREPLERVVDDVLRHESQLLLLVDLDGEVAVLRHAEQLEVQVLAAQPVLALSLDEILLAGLRLVVRMQVLLVLQLVVAVREGTLFGGEIRVIN